MKHFFVLALSAVLLLGALTGCKNKDTVSDDPNGSINASQSDNVVDDITDMVMPETTERRTEATTEDRTEASTDNSESTDMPAESTEENNARSRRGLAQR